MYGFYHILNVHDYDKENMFSRYRIASSRVDHFGKFLKQNHVVKQVDYYYSIVKNETILLLTM